MLLRKILSRLPGESSYTPFAQKTGKRTDDIGPENQKSEYIPVCQDKKFSRDSAKKFSTESCYIPVTHSSDKNLDNPYQARKRSRDRFENSESSYQPVHKKSNRDFEISQPYKKNSRNARDFEENPYKPVKSL